METLVELLAKSCAEHGPLRALGSRAAEGWRWLTYAELEVMVDQARAGLAAHGVRAGDRVALLSSNRAEWPVVCYAALGLGAVVVPMYEQQRAEDWRFILEDSGASLAVVSRASIADSIRSAQARLPALREVVCMDARPGERGSLERLLVDGAMAPTPRAEVAPDSLAEIIYTSGTTGRPKGALLTHAAITSDVRAIQQLFPITSEESSVAFLPWAHVLGQIGELHTGLACGIAIAINDELGHLLDRISEIKPTLLVAVPAIFNRIYQAVARQVGAQPRLLQKLFRDGVEAAVKLERGQPVSRLRRLELALDDKLIFGKIRARLGGRIKWVFSGGAALAVEVAELLDALGIPVHEGYGLTETACTVSMQPRGERKVGTVGKPLPGVRVDIDAAAGEDGKVGEIIVHGPILMRGYHGRPEETAAVMTPDGGLRTGDLGYFDDEGYLVIAGRIKEQYKLANGKYVAPVALEEQIKLSPYIKNVMIHGADRPYNVALVIPDQEAIAQRAASMNGDAGSVADLIAAEIATRCRELRGYEVPRRMHLVDEDFTIENGLLTPTMKLRRARVAARYAREIDELYAQDEPAVSAGR